MIKSFGDKRTAQIYEGRYVKRLDTDLQRKALRRLRYIEAAQTLEDLRVPPSNKLEKKTGDLKDFYAILKDFYAIWVNTQWRIIFKWKDGDAFDVQFIDYH